MSEPSPVSDDKRPIIKTPWKARLRIALTLTIVIGLITFFAFNHQSVTLDLIFKQIELPAGVLYFTLLLSGFLLGLLSRRLPRRKRKR